MANAIPLAGSGSVTQSSNVNNGVTAERVSVTTTYGTGGRHDFTVSGGDWSISTANGNPRYLPGDSGFNGVELYRRVNGGELYVDVFSDIEAPETTTVTTTIPGQPQDVGSGDRIVGLSCLGPRCAADTQEGTLNGVSGTFSCPSGCSIQFGGVSLSSGSNISFEGASFNGRVVGQDEFSVTSATGITFTPAQSTQLSEQQTTPDTDYLSGGIWLFVPDDATSFNDAVFGAFADGSDPFVQGTIRGFAGTASYDGVATGQYRVYSVGSGEDYVDYWEGIVGLTADFGGAGDMGTISGRVTGLVESGGDSLPGSMTLGSAAIGSANSGFFHGQLSGTVDGIGYTGRWGGQFFGNGEAHGQPGSVAGTLGGGAADSSGAVAFTGVFGAHNDRNGQ